MLAIIRALAFGARVPRRNMMSDDLLAALRLAQRLFDEALPKFNWGASALDANAIRLLNEVPIAVRKAIMKAECQS